MRQASGVLGALGALFRDAALNWVRDYAQSMGAALAFYTIFSIAPLLLIVIAIAGFFFGEEAARGEIYLQLQGMLGSHGALAVQDLLESAGRRAASLPAALALAAGAPRVFVIGGGELYRQALPLAHELLLTEVDADLDGDTFFPPWDRSLFAAEPAEAHVTAAGVPFRITRYRRRAV